MGIWNKFFRRNLESYDFEIDITTAERIKLKEMALETCINFIARNFAQSEFRVMKKTKRVKKDWDYLLNVRPNTDQSSSDFWQSFVAKLIRDNEVLVILSDRNELLIADSFVRDEKALYDDIFSSVTVKNYTFKRTFLMQDVIYLNYNNEKLTSYLNELFKDYAELYGRMIEASQRAYQIRAKIGVDSTQSLDEKTQTKLQNMINKMFKSIKNSSIALMPILKGFTYDEVSNGSHAGPGVAEIDKMKRSTTDAVAEALGIPTALIHGEMADLDNTMKAFIKFCLNPLIKKVQDELNAKIFDKRDYMNGNKIVVYGIKEKNLIENAEAVDKLVASGAYTRNEVREKFGDERVDDPELDRYVITKNYQTVDDAAKGGENDEKTDEK